MRVVKFGLAGALAFALVVAAAVIGLRISDSRAVLPADCWANANGTSYELEPEQAANASLMTAVALGKKMPPRAATIAIATALQESKLRNLDHGDRDSLGLFQQRPSQGWGTPTQIMDPVYASERFLSALGNVPGYESMRIAKAAQAVQASAFPDAYADHEPNARAYASALTGNAGAALACRLGSPKNAGDPRTVERALSEQFGSALDERVPTTEKVTRNGVSRRAVVIAADSESTRWALANWAVAQAENKDIVAAEANGRAWNRSERAGRWAAPTAAEPQGGPSTPRRGTVRIVLAAAEDS